jgi:hypothetical protein
MGPLICCPFCRAPPLHRSVMKERTDRLSTDVVSSMPSVRFHLCSALCVTRGTYVAESLSRLHTHPSPYPTERTLSPSLAYQTHDCLPEKKPTTNTPRQHKKKKNNHVVQAPYWPPALPLAASLSTHHAKQQPPFPRTMGRPPIQCPLPSETPGNEFKCSLAPRCPTYVLLLPPCALRGRNKKHVANKTLTAIELRTVHIHTCEAKRRVSTKSRTHANYQQQQLTRVALNPPQTKIPRHS